jgi:hypothetical protein
MCAPLGINSEEGADGSEPEFFARGKHNPVVTVAAVSKGQGNTVDVLLKSFERHKHAATPDEHMPLPVVGRSRAWVANIDS